MRKALFLGLFVISLISLVLADTTVSNVEIITTGNVTANWFFGNISCTNITGAGYDVCIGDGIGSGNITNLNISWTADTNFGGYSLTNVGSMIMSGLIYSQNITPAVDNLYSLGNSTNWFKNIFVHDVYADTINASVITTTELNSSDVNSDRINTTNATIGGFDVYRDGAGDLNINLD